jgi:adenosine deaminase
MTVNTLFMNTQTFSPAIHQPTRFNLTGSIKASPSALRAINTQAPSFGATKPALPAQVAGVAKTKRIDDDVYQLYRATPKVDLHEHQSGSADLAALKTALIMKGQTSKLGWEEIREDYRVSREGEAGAQTIPTTAIVDDGSLRPLTKPDPTLESYRKTSDKINPLVKNPSMAYLSAHLFALEAVSENVRHAEYRLYPDKQGDTMENIVKYVEDGFKDAIYRLERSRKPFNYGLIFLMPRMGDETVNPKTGVKIKVEKAVEMAHKAIELKQKGHKIVGIDLAGDELNCPVWDFAPAFEVIHRYNDSVPEAQRIGITIHAGETPTSGAKPGWYSVQEALRVGHRSNTPFRIGHGVHLLDSSSYLKEAFLAFLTDPDWEKKYPKANILAQTPLLKEIIEKGVCLEMCPKSNIQTRAIEDYLHHPAVFFSRLGVKVSISSDNRTISNSDNTNEFVKLFKYGRITYQDRKNMILNAARSAFIFDPEEKKTLVEGLEKEFQDMERNPKYAVALYKEKHRLNTVRPIKKFLIGLMCELQDITYQFKQYWQSLKGYVQGWCTQTVEKQEKPT